MVRAWAIMCSTAPERACGLVVNTAITMMPRWLIEAYATRRLMSSCTKAIKAA
ncbi:hypothetical protein D3C78_1822350 [compost metagenome]